MKPKEIKKTGKSAIDEKASCKLNDISKDYLLQEIALAPFEGRTYDNIIKTFKDQFGHDISDSTLSYLKKNNPDVIADKMQEIAGVIVKTIPIAVKGFRLNEIWKAYGKAKGIKEKLMCLRSAQSETNDVGDKIADAIKNSGDKHYHFNFGDMSNESINRLAGQYSRMLGTVNRNN